MSLTAYHRTMEEHAALKRFNERWVADPRFRSALAGDPATALQSCHIPCSPEDVRMPAVPDLSDPPPCLRAMWQIVVTKTRWVHEFYHERGNPEDARIRAWRARHVARQLLELGPFHAKSNIHASLAIELTRGCSVGCWFCALSPERLTQVFRHDEANRALWRGTLEALSGCLGPAARTGFLYWASDPLDNPEYEQFCLDFHDVIGVFPPTTTALALRDPARTRALLALSDQRGCWLNRFSILSLKQLDQVHAEFTADELAHVECLPLNRESAFAFGNAGRFRERTLVDPELLNRQRRNLRFAPWYTGDPAYADGLEYPLASIGCVTGFLLNMCERRVRLISPCAASDRWPLGYCVHDDARFETADDLADQLARMVERHMSPVLRPGDRLRFHPWLAYERLEDGFQLAGRFRSRVAFRGGAHAAAWRAIGERIHASEGTHQAGTGATTGATTDAITERVVRAVSSELDLDQAIVQAMLDELLRAGVLDELPD